MSSLQGILILIFLTRTTDPTLVGEFILIQSLAWFFSILFLGGLQFSIIRELQTPSLDSAGRLSHFTTSCCDFALQTLIWILALAVVGAAVQSTFDIALSKYSFALYWGVGLGANLFVSEALKGIGKIHLSAFVLGIFPALFILVVLVAKVLFHSEQGDLVNLSFITLALASCQFLPAVAGGLLFVRGSRLRDLLGGPVLKISRGLIARGASRLHLSGSTLAIYLFTQMDVWLCRSLGTAEDLAVYGVAQRMVLLATFPAMVLASSLLPEMNRAWQEKQSHMLYKISRRIGQLSFIPAIGVLAALLVFGNGFMVWLFGQDYRQSHLVATILVSAYCLQISFGPLGYLLMMTNLEKRVLYTMLICGSLFVVLASAGFATYGVLSIATSLAVVLVLQILIYHYLAVKNLAFPKNPFRHLGSYRINE